VAAGAHDVGDRPVTEVHKEAHGTNERKREPGAGALLLSHGWPRSSGPQVGTVAGSRGRIGDVLQAHPRVAVLDDEDDAAASICQCLALQRLQAFPFTDPAELLLVIEKHAMDAFVLDWSLGDRTSCGLVEALRADPIVCSAPIFILTGTLAVGGRPVDPRLFEVIRTYRLQFRTKPFSCTKLALDLRTAIGLNRRPA